jgi:acyl-CoA dehydrogenase
MLLTLIVAAFLLVALLFLARPWLAWVVAAATLFVGTYLTGIEYPKLFTTNAVIFGLVALVFARTPVRRMLITGRLLPLVKPILPQMSETEREALEAGTVWWEAEFFSGNPRWRRLLDFQPKDLTEKERAFLDGPAETVCSMLTEWEVNRAGDLPEEVWSYLGEQGFFGMIIPERYGGLGFSAWAHSAVVTKLSSRSTALGVTVMVPNSLGPAELLMHYGTQAQKDHYLPRLARGEEIPAFALTEPGAGSDAGGMTSNGVVCEGTFEGRQVLGIRLNWDKRYITLVSRATVLGLAFKLRDPDHLLGSQVELGITCALIPTDLPGVVTGERHDPLGIAFINGPTQGHDVFVPLDAIIGGRANAGKGWGMLMQSLAAGRGISLPSNSSAAAKLAVRGVGAYATVRQQFGMSIGKFEGVQEPISRIAGRCYYMDAMRRLTCGAVDAGEKPSVATAIAKAWMTESMRRVLIDAMDVVGGSGISLGPRNIFGHGYQGAPIAITVEGANILTRSMIVFGQGAIRCHPHVQDELNGAFGGNLKLFDRAFFGHVGFVVTNMARSFVHGLTGGALAKAPVGGPLAPYYQRLTRASASFAMISDFAMGTLGGALKRKEAITGRLADALAWQLIASAALKRFHDEGSLKRDLPYVTWSCEHALYEVQEALRGVLRNLPLRPVAWLLQALTFPLGARWAPPDDRLAHRMAEGILDGREARESLSEGMYVPPRDELGLGQLEATLDLVVRAQSVHRKVKEAVKAKRLERKPKDTLLERALAEGVIGEAEIEMVRDARAARERSIAVDAFGAEQHAELSH